MAIFYARLSVVSRGKGHSAVAAAAYRCAARLRDERTGALHNFEKKTGVIVGEMLAPENAPWALDLAQVWCRAEQAEVRCNARVARELIVALPAELERPEQIALARCIGRDLVDGYGIAVLVAVHEPDRGGDARNAHVHFLMSTRCAASDGFGPKVRCLDDQKTGPQEAEAIRARVARRINEALAENGCAARVDSRRLSVQAQEAAERGDLEAVAALTRTPMRHVGRAATAAVRRGETSAVVSANAQTASDNLDVRARGRRRAVRMRDDIQDEVARRAAVRRATETSPRPVPARTSPAGTARPQASAIEVYLKGLNDTERLVRELVRSGDRVDVLRERIARTDRQTGAALARTDRIATRIAEDVEAEAVSKPSRPSRGADPSPIPVGPAAVAEPRPPSATPGSSMTKRQWADVRRQQRTRMDADEPTAVDVETAEQGSLGPAPIGFKEVAAWRATRRQASSSAVKPSPARGQEGRLDEQRWRRPP